MSDEKLAELEEQRAQKKADAAKAKAEQLYLDEVARDELEDEYGAIAAVKVARHVPGQPVIAFVRTPKPEEYKRYVGQVGKGVEKKSAAAQRDAQELLARACWIYPRTREQRDAMLEVFPGLLTILIHAVTALAEGKAEEEGKG